MGVRVHACMCVCALEDKHACKAQSLRACNTTLLLDKKRRGVGHTRAHVHGLGDALHLLLGGAPARGWAGGAEGQRVPRRQLLQVQPCARLHTACTAGQIQLQVGNSCAVRCVPAAMPLTGALPEGGGPWAATMQHEAWSGNEQQALTIDTAATADTIDIDMKEELFWQQA